MIILDISGRGLTEGELDSIHRFHSCADGVAFACLREGVMAMLPEESAPEREAMLACARGIMEETLRTPPDITLHQMQDGSLMASMPSGLCAISDGPVEKSDMAGFLLWFACVQSCDAGRILALCYEED